MSGELEYGPVYKAIEGGLYAAAPMLILLIALSYPSTETRRQFEADMVHEAVAESQSYCTKWGFVAGTPKYLECLRDLFAVRENAAQRLRDAVALDF